MVDKKFLLVCRGLKLSPRIVTRRIKAAWIAQVEQLYLAEKILQQIRNGSNAIMAKPRRQAPAPDPLSSVVGEDTNDPMADLGMGEVAEEEDPLGDVFGADLGSAPEAAPVPGMAGLRGAVSAQTIRESVSRGGAAGPDPVVAGALADIQAKVAGLAGFSQKLDALTLQVQKLAEIAASLQKTAVVLDQKQDANSATVLGAIMALRDALSEEEAESWDEKAERLDLPQQIDNTGTSSKQQKQAAPQLKPQKTVASPIVETMLPFLKKRQAAEAAAGRKFGPISLANKSVVFGSFSKQLALVKISATPDAVEKAFADAGLIQDGLLHF